MLVMFFCFLCFLFISFFCIVNWLRHTYKQYSHENIHKFPHLKRQQARSTKSTAGSRKSGGLSVANPNEAMQSPNRKNTEYTANILFDMFRKHEQSISGENEENSNSNQTSPKTKSPKTKSPKIKSPKTKSPKSGFFSSSSPKLSKSKAPPRQWPPPSNSTPATAVFEKNQSKPMPSHNRDSITRMNSNDSVKINDMNEMDSKSNQTSPTNSVQSNSPILNKTDQKAVNFATNTKDTKKSNVTASEVSEMLNRVQSADSGSTNYSNSNIATRNLSHSRYQSVMNFIEMDVRPQLAKMEAENEKLRKNVAHYKGSFEDLTKENDHLNTQIERLQEQLKLKEFSEDSMKIAKLEQENRDLKLQVSELHDISIQHAELQQQNQTIMEINESLQKQIGNNASGAVGELETLNELINKFNNEQNSIINELKREKEELLSNLKESEHKNQELTNQIVKLQEQDLSARRKHSMSTKYVSLYLIFVCLASIGNVIDCGIYVRVRVCVDFLRDIHLVYNENLAN